MKTKLLRVALVCLVAVGLIVASVWLLVEGCTRDRSDWTCRLSRTITHPVSLHQVEQIGSYTALMLRFLLWFGELPEPVSV